MAFVSQSGPSTAIQREGSRTVIAEETQANDSTSQQDTAAEPTPSGTLHLRGGPRNRPRVAWDGDVVDNEGLGKKKSKICCIYHRPKRFDESSDEDSSGSESDSDDGTARPSHKYRHRHHHHGDGENGADPHGSLEHRRRSDNDDRNAYERVPPRKGKGKSAS
ncbi:phosphatase inhibitor-domain-containing protein [Gloeopeniophorella convolvens]|nr:phosphatase inhibitor-domain-containing protein [Gloeopeniophorella convolvens]